MDSRPLVPFAAANTKTAEGLADGSWSVAGGRVAPSPMHSLVSGGPAESSVATHLP